MPKCREGEKAHWKKVKGHGEYDLSIYVNLYFIFILCSPKMFKCLGKH